MIKNQLLILFSLAISFGSYAQDIGVGGSAMYNFQTESFGFGLRTSIFPNKTVSFVPQLTYYPSFNKVSEITLGLAIEAKLIRTRKLNWYVLAHGGYNNWLNAEESPMEGAQTTNWNMEVGGGVTTNHCLRPFLEYRYNLKFQETHLRLGFLYIFGCKKNGGGGRGYSCPAYQLG